MTHAHSSTEAPPFQPCPSHLTLHHRQRWKPVFASALLDLSRVQIFCQHRLFLSSPIDFQYFDIFMSSLPSPPTSPAAGPSSCALPLKIKLPFRTIAPLPSSPLSSTFISDDALDTDRFQSALILNNTQDDLPPLSPADSPPIIPTLYPTLPLDPATFIFDLHMLSRQNTTYPPDSGLGSSIASTEEDYTLSPKKFPETTVSASTLTGSASSRVDETIPAFGQSALSRIHEHIIRPLGEDPNLKEFQPIVHDVPLRIESKEIICLRDIEKTLLLLAPVRSLPDDTLVCCFLLDLLSKRHAKSLALYIEFCLSSIRCIQATVHYLVDHEQTRPGDRPYSSGYFIDLKEQIYEYGRQLATARAKHLPEDAGLDSYASIGLPLLSLHPVTYLGLLY